MLDKRIVVYIIENIYETSILPNDWQELKKSLGALTKKTPGWTTLSTLNHTKTATSVLMSWNDAQIVLDKYNQDGLCTWFQELSGTANRSIKYSSSSSNLLCNRPTQIIGNPLRVHIRNDSAPSPFQTHVKNDDGLPINVQAGALLGVRCSIFISGISFKCVEADLWKFVKEKSGRVVEDCILLKNKRSGTSKGQAIVKFMSHMDAKQALSTLHQCSFMGRELHARIAKDTVVGKPVLPECVVSYI